MKQNLLFASKIVLLSFCMLLTVKTYAQSSKVFATYVPDDNFEQALIDLGYDSGPLDDYVPTSNIDGVTELSVSSKNISDLTGIEDFSALVELYCHFNQLTSLDLSANLNLSILDCSLNSITSLDFSANTKLSSLKCSSNQLESLNVSSNLNLTTLMCGANKLSSVDISANTVLIDLHISENKLTSLDLSNNTNLNMLICRANQLSSLDLSNNIVLEVVHCQQNSIAELNVSNNTNLEILSCCENEITSLNVLMCPSLKALICYDNQLTNLVVSPNTALTSLWCNSNQLTSLDLSTNTALQYLHCEDNQLSSLNLTVNTELTDFICNENQLSHLDIRNGNNSDITSFTARDNPDLTCIYVDDKTATYLDDWDIDDAAEFVNNETECNNAPSDIILSNSSIDEGMAAETIIGTFTAADEDTDDTHTFSFIAGDGTNDADNSSFIIENDELKSNEQFDYETKTEYNIYIQVEDAGGLTYEKAFVININDVVETGIGNIDQNSISTYPNPVNDILYITQSNSEYLQINVYDLTGKLKFSNKYNSEKLKIDLSNFESGVYIVSFESNENSFTRKIIKQ